MNKHPMTTRGKKREREAINREALNKDTKKLIKTVVEETEARIQLFEQKLDWIQNWKPGESFPDGYCFCNTSDEEIKSLDDLRQEEIKSLEDDLRQEKKRLLSWQEELKQIEEEDGEKSDAKRHKKSDAKRREKSDATRSEIQDFEAYVSSIGRNA